MLRAIQMSYLFLSYYVLRHSHVYPNQLHTALGPAAYLVRLRDPPSIALVEKRVGRG